MIPLISPLAQRKPFSFVVSGDVTDSLAVYLGAHLLREPAEMRHWVRQRYILVNHLPARFSRPPNVGDLIHVNPPVLTTPVACPENISLERVYEDTHLVVVNKPTGMATHPSSGWWKGSCVNALLYHTREWPGIKGVAGPGIVHRLDKNTSGLLLFAKTHFAQQRLLKDLQARHISRCYVALTEPFTPTNKVLKGSWQGTLAPDPTNSLKYIVSDKGKRAVTHYQVLLQGPKYTLFGLQLETGRTHQIRVHLQQAGAPILSDGLYGTKTDKPMALHAYHLAFAHPISREPMRFFRLPPWLEAHGLVKTQTESLLSAAAPSFVVPA